MDNPIPKLLNLLFPKTCQHCGDPFESGLSNILCRACFDAMPTYEDPLCDHCGAALPARAFEDAVAKRCRDCGEGHYFLDEVRALGPYGGTLRIVHHSFKFEGMEHFKKDIAAKMTAAIPPSFWEGIEALVPVPQSPERERERGYNPALHLGVEVSSLARIPCVKILEKTRTTLPQMTLTREERFKNPRGAYRQALGTAVPGKILLVDDVFTTGSTLEECAKVLKRSGADWVGAIVFGRTEHW